MIAGLYIDEIILGSVDLQISDENMGVVSGLLKPNENYQKYKDEFRDFTESHGVVNVQTHNLSVRLENKLKLEPEGGIAVYDIKELNEIQVDVSGLGAEIIEEYFK